MEYTRYQRGHGIDDQGADTFFVRDHSKGCPEHGKPPEYTVVFLIEHIKNTDCAGDPEYHILQGNKKVTVSDQAAQYQKSIICNGNNNAHQKRMQKKGDLIYNILAHRHLFKQPGKKRFPFAAHSGLF